MRLRVQPEDFRVDEVLRAGVLLPAGPHAVYRLTKRGLTTPGACARLSRALGARGGAAWAGLKDKHALTTQHVSVRTDAPPPRVDAEGLQAELLGRAAEPAQASWIAGNRFTLTLRGVTDAAHEQLLRGAAALRLPARGGVAGPLVVPNYFGAQRMRSARTEPSGDTASPARPANRDDPRPEQFPGRALLDQQWDVALRLLLASPARKDTGPRGALARAAAEHWGNWDEALRRAPACAQRRALEALARGEPALRALACLPHLDRQMALDAYRSHLWNLAACEVLRECGAPLAAGAGWTRSTRMLFPAPVASLPRSLLAVQTELPAPQSAGAGAWKRGLERVLAQADLPRERLLPHRELGLKAPATPRPLLVLAEAFFLTRLPREDAPDASLASFTLPSGAYATVLLAGLHASGQDPTQPAPAQA